MKNMKPSHAAALALYLAAAAIAFQSKHFRVVAVMGALWGCMFIIGAYRRWPFFAEPSAKDRWYVRLLRCLSLSPFRDQIGARWVIRLTYLVGVLIIVCEMLALRSIWTLN
jgi:hypothetical protein